jgi:hypothetical protein
MFRFYSSQVSWQAKAETDALAFLLTKSLIRCGLNFSGNSILTSVFEAIVPPTGMVVIRHRLL